MDFNLFGLSDVAMLRLRIIVAAVLALVLAMGVLWYGEWRADAVRAATEAKYEGQINRQKVEAATRLTTETDKVLKLERDLLAAETKIEEMGHDREALSADYEKRLVTAAARNGGRLRDPNATGCRNGGGGAQSAAAAGAGESAAGGAQTGGLLSVPLTDLLQRIVREAGEQSDAYAECRADTFLIRSRLSPSP